MRRERPAAAELSHSSSHIIGLGALAGVVVGGLAMLAYFAVSVAVADDPRYWLSSSTVYVVVFATLFAAFAGLVAGLVTAAGAVLFGSISSTLLKRADIGLGVGALLFGTAITEAVFALLGPLLSASPWAFGAASVGAGMLAAALVVLEWDRDLIIGRRAHRHGGRRDPLQSRELTL